MTEADRARRRQHLWEASEWIARIHAEDCTDADRDNFAAWLDGDEGHRLAFERATDAYDAVNPLTQPDWAPAGASVPNEDDKPERPHVSRRLVLAGVGALVVGGSTVGWQAAYARRVETGFAERRSLQLGEGTLLQLDSETSIRIPRFRQNVVELMEGRISVQGDTSALVLTPDHEIQCAHADMDVSLRGRDLSVALLRGNVTIQSAGQRAITLSAGERLNPNGTVDRPSMDHALAWREGRLIFDDSTLAAASADLNRYDRRQIILDAQSSQLRISGTYPIGKNADFANAVAQLLPVRITQTGQEIHIKSHADPR